VTATAIPGTAVPIPAVLLGPETAREHIANALQIVMNADRTTVSGRVALTAEEYAGVCYRLQRAIEQIEGHVCALPAGLSEALNSGDGVYRP